MILFGMPESKDEEASGAYDDDGIVQRAIRAIKREVPGLLVMTDVCNCEYTSHGHCGKIVDGDVDNDATLEWLAQSARVARARRRRYRGAFRHDGRPRGGDPHGARRQRLYRTRRFCPTRPSSPRCFTGRSAKPPNPRRSSATGAAIRWTRPTGARPCARSSSIWKKAPT